MFFIMSSAVKMTELCVCPSSCQNVSPSGPVRFIRDHHSEWADFNVDAYSAASLKAGSYAYPGMRPTSFAGIQIIMLFGHTIGHEGGILLNKKMLLNQETFIYCRYAGVDENALGACSEFVFAPIDNMFPDDGPLLPFGFCIIPLDSKTPDSQDMLTTHRTLDLTSSLEVGPATNPVAGDSSSCRGTSSVQRVAMAICPSGLTPTLGLKLSPGSPEVVTLAH
ncbi:hypothetical protein KPL70_012125 [Citrus sinensis]|nr:hypothetical protein KPL70_012125 [Citrus sinensis]